MRSGEIKMSRRLAIVLALCSTLPIVETSGELGFWVPSSAAPLADAIPSDFVSFSIEVESSPLMLNGGAPGAPPRASYAALMRFLGSASPSMRGANVRVGGSSADASTFGEAGDPLPTNVTYLVTDSDLESLPQCSYGAGLLRST